MGGRADAVVGECRSQKEITNQVGIYTQLIRGDPAAGGQEPIP
jgi:hypothetical protein